MMVRQGSGFHIMGMVCWMGMVVPVGCCDPHGDAGASPVDGEAALVLRTQGGVSDTVNLTILPAAPGVFRDGTAGPENESRRWCD